MKTTDIEYRDGALTCRGFLAYDETKTGRRPGVLVVHEAFGLGKHAMDRAKMLVELGYVAFAADMFGDRMQVTELPKAIEIITDLLGDPPKLLARADAALTSRAWSTSTARSRPRRRPRREASRRESSPAPGRTIR
jgi:dienelactone hydrolase